MEYIYSRVSTDKQDTNNQLSSLKMLYPNAIVIEEVASGAKHRPLLSKLIPELQRGDMLIVAALDRLGRHLKEIITLIEDLDARGVIIKSVREGIDYSSLAGRLVTQILCSVAEMERGLISERTRASLKAKQRQGIRIGRPLKYGLDTILQIYSLHHDGLPLRAIATKLDMSHEHVRTLLKRRA